MIARPGPAGARGPPQPTSSARSSAAPALPLRAAEDRDVLEALPHDISLSRSGVWRILRRLGRSRLPTSQRYTRHVNHWKRYEKPEPGHQVQIDVKIIDPLPGSRRKHYQFTAIDDCTRLRVLRIYDQLGQKSAIQFVDYVLEKLPFHVRRIQTDNGSSSRPSSTGVSSIAGSSMSTSGRPRHT